MTDGRIDLNPLDPGRDPDRIERIVGNVLSGIGAGEAPMTWTAPLARVWIPALLAAAAAAFLAFAVPGPTERSPSTTGYADPLAVSIGVPAPLAHWAATAEHPPAGEVLTAMEAYPR